MVCRDVVARFDVIMVRCEMWCDVECDWNAAKGVMWNMAWCGMGCPGMLHKWCDVKLLWRMWHMQCAVRLLCQMWKKMQRAAIDVRCGGMWCGIWLMWCEIYCDVECGCGVQSLWMRNGAMWTVAMRCRICCALRCGGVKRWWDADCGVMWCQM